MQICSAGAEPLRAEEQAHGQAEEWTDGRTDMTWLFEILRTLLKFDVKPKQCIYVFCVYLSDYFPIQL